MAKKVNFGKVLPHYAALGVGAGLAGTVQGYVSQVTDQYAGQLGENAKYVAPGVTALLGMYIAETQRDKNMKALGTGLAAGSIGALVSDAIGAINGLSEAEISSWMAENVPANASPISSPIGAAVNTGSPIGSYEQAQEEEDIYTMA